MGVDSLFRGNVSHNWPFSFADVGCQAQLVVHGGLEAASSIAYLSC